MSFGKAPKHNMKAAEDFLEVVLYAHVLSATKQVMKTSDTSRVCKAAAKSVVETFVRISLSFAESISPPVHEKSDDTVYAYATDFLTLGLLWHGFHDCIQSGNGNRILIY